MNANEIQFLVGAPLIWSVGVLFGVGATLFGFMVGFIKVHIKFYIKRSKNEDA